jgi:pseudouridine-5'-monophosphatase
MLADFKSLTAVVWIPDPELVSTLGSDHGLNASHQHSSMEDFDPAAWGLPPYDS